MAGAFPILLASANVSENLVFPIADFNHLEYTHHKSKPAGGGGMTLPKRAVIIIASVGMLLVAGVGTSVAQTDEQLADYSRPGPYMGLFFVYGKEALDVSNIEDKIETDLAAARMSAVEIIDGMPETECDPNLGIPCQTKTLVDRNDGFGGAFRAGYRFNSLFAAELDLQGIPGFEIDRDLYRPRPGFENNAVIAAANRKVEADIDIYSAMVNGKLYPLQGVIQPYLLGGLGTVIGHADEKANNGGKNTEALFGGRIGGGIDYYLTRNFVLNFDISYTVTTTTFKPDGFEDEISLTHVPISAGLIYRFGLPAPPAAPPPPPPPPPAAAAPMKKRIILRGVNFDFDKANIRADAKPVLDEAISTLKDAGDVRVSVEGHTDSRGTDAYNQGLSVRRANAVADYLESGGIDRSRLEVTGFGESKPIATNETDDGRAQNRRVELNVLP
jgi:OOP family OmpA-OmpF porin